MEDVIKKKLCNFCKNTNCKNCMKTIYDTQNKLITYKFQNYIKKGEIQMDKEEVEKFRKRNCEKCKENNCDGLVDNGLEIVCKTKNIHMKKSFEKTQEIKKTRN